MAEQQSTFNPTLVEGRDTMLQSALVLLFCLLVGAISLGVCVWVAISGQLFTMDGLLTVSISLLVGALFMANVGWSVYSGELRAILDSLRRKSGQNEAATDSQSEGKE
ncbi:MAG: hypothetical protein HYS33_05045 [Acidobacteria bacterium]|nr:hypothetical protein [Acidobacteriota bacterium]